jgi:hypothetical protein
VIPGLEVAIKSMKKKEKSDYLFGPEYAYGAMGCPPRLEQLLNPFLAGWPGVDVDHNFRR